MKYVRLPELLDEFISARNDADGSFRRLIKKYKKVDLLIIDELCKSFHNSSYGQRFVM
ncbi:hypothetical protein [Alkalibacterium sp. s-m-28]